MKTILGQAVLALVLAVPAFAQSPKWSLSFDVGGEVPVSGNVHDGGTGTVLALPTTVDARTQRDIYGTSLKWAGSLGYHVTDKGELRMRVFRSTGTATQVQVGNVATLPLFAQFASYQGVGVDAGYRGYYASAESRVRPYAGASAGFVRTDKIDSTFTVPAASVVLSNVSMNGASTVFTFGVSGGVVVPLNKYVGIQGGAELRWQGDLKAVDGLAGTGLESINDKTRRWTMPVTVGIVTRF